MRVSGLEEERAARVLSAHAGARRRGRCGVAPYPGARPAGGAAGLSSGVPFPGGGGSGRRRERFRLARALALALPLK